MTIYNLQSQLYLLTALIEYLTVLLAYIWIFFKLSCRAQQAFGKAWALLGVPLSTRLFETNVSHVLHVSAILVSDYSCFVLVHGLCSGIILTKIVTYYS